MQLLSIVVDLLGVEVAPPRHHVFQVFDGERSGRIDERLLGPRELLGRFLAGRCHLQNADDNVTDGE